MVRKHFILPRELAEDFERRVGARNQSAQIAQLIERWLRNQSFGDVVQKYAGFATAEDHPEWATPEGISAWVRDLRATGWESEASARVLRETRDD